MRAATERRAVIPPAPTTTGTGGRTAPLIPAFAGGQAVNVRRHLVALRDFTRDEFGTSAARPSEGHIQAVNALLAKLRRPLEGAVSDLERVAREVEHGPASTGQLHELLRRKSRAHDWVRATERVWDFYFDVFGQRTQEPYNQWLLSCDRIALDCYQHVYMHLGSNRSIPAPPPFTYMRTGFSPATYRRNIPLRKLGRQLNPFPLVQLPYHRLVNPWTMGAIMHEVSHNLQNELGLEEAVPRSILRTFRAAGIDQRVAAIYGQWNREIFGDVMGCLLGGEAFVASLLDVIGRSPEQAMGFNPHGVHPTPYLRTFISTELLRRMGFPEAAATYDKAWRRLYPSTAGSNLPPALVRTAKDAIPAVVEAVAFTRFPSLGDRSLRQVITFGPRHQLMIEEAAQRLARGTDPGVVPERFLIGAVRIAVDRKLADPERLMRNFYLELSRR
ncbi:hypothetical protein GCM10011584_00730 [Nocardioides phosphati]|uniref:DUF4932 domain-containing protein n=1 Tax=Nocardioides phosphati TaxID=1867775 RepID=A0ABQ2N4I4_9ACTN|nr:hypothetical protein GCM10011584_00730 [Nocardioides phosphati]